MMRGFILLMMLVYLQIFSLLAMQAMTVVGGYKKSIFHDSNVMQQRRQALLLLQGVNKLHVVSCQLAPHGVDQIEGVELWWWRRNACHDVNKGSEYFYVREDLGSDPCGTMEDVDKQQLAVRYYRDTLLYLSSLSYYQSVLVQATIAVPERTSIRCSEEVKRINPGRQMLRWLW